MAGRNYYEWRGFDDWVGGRAVGRDSRRTVLVRGGGAAAPLPRSRAEFRRAVGMDTDPNDVRGAVNRGLHAGGSRLDRAMGAAYNFVEGVATVGGMRGSTASRSGSRSAPEMRVSEGNPAVSKGTVVGTRTTRAIGGGWPVEVPVRAAADIPAEPDTVSVSWGDLADVNSNPLFRLSPIKPVAMPVEKTMVATTDASGFWRQAPMYTAPTATAAAELYAQTPDSSATLASGLADRLSGIAKGLGFEANEGLQSAYLSVQDDFNKKRGRAMDDEVAVIRAGLASGALTKEQGLSIARALRARRDAELAEGLGLSSEAVVPMSYRPDGTFGPAADQDMLTDEQSRFVAARMAQEAAGGGNSPLKLDASGRHAAQDAGKTARRGVLVPEKKSHPMVWGYVAPDNKKVFYFPHLEESLRNADYLVHAIDGAPRPGSGDLFQLLTDHTYGAYAPWHFRKFSGERGQTFLNNMTKAFAEAAKTASPTGGVVRVPSFSPRGGTFVFPYSRLITEEIPPGRRGWMEWAGALKGSALDTSGDPYEEYQPRGITLRQMDAKGGKSAS